jgi:hypothetical protein
MTCLVIHSLQNKASIHGTRSGAVVDSMGKLGLLPQTGSSLPTTPRFTPGESPAVVLRNGVLFQGTQAAKSPLGPGYYNLPNNEIVKKVI